jgi:hypothetical protein
VLARHRGGLDAVARALLDEETIDGETVGRLVDTAYGRPVHAAGVKTVPPIFVASQHGPTGSDDADGPPVDQADAGTASVPGSPAPVPSTAPGTGQPVEEAETVSNAADAGGATNGDSPAPGAAAPGNGPNPQMGPWPQAPSTWPAKQAPWPPPPPPASR